MVVGDGGRRKYADPVQGVKESYNKGVTDEFIDAVCCAPMTQAKPVGTIRDDDSCICFNFRADRGGRLRVR